jgi:sulfate adenylyltransferase subunit 2
MKMLTHLERLEAESDPHHPRGRAEAEKPVMLYSVGKDSAVMLHLARKAFYPVAAAVSAAPCGYDLEVQGDVRAARPMAKESGMELLVYQNPEAAEKGINPFDHGPLHTDMWKTEGLKQALDNYGFDAAFGGARRDEEKSRAKERIFSFRTASHGWDPKNQRPELWNLYNARKNKGESIRVFPISNWTELDVWQYIQLNDIPIVPLYFAAKRARPWNGKAVADGRRRSLPAARSGRRCPRLPKNRPFPHARLLPADRCGRERGETLSEVIQETLLTTTSERQGRVIDKDAGGAGMEKKKQEGYF